MLLFLKLIFHKQNFSDLFLTYWELFNLIKVYTSCVRMVKKFTSQKQKNHLKFDKLKCLCDLKFVIVVITVCTLFT